MWNTAKEAWAAGGVTYGAWLSIPDELVADTVGRLGFDWVCVDMQHGVIDEAAARAIIRALRAAGAVPFVRVPWNDFGIIGKMLDAGALGIIVPMVNSAAEAAAVVAACRYPPLGARSFGPTMASVLYGSDYFTRANDEIACIPMVETRQALDALDDILAVPGVDAVYVGPADLSLSLGLPPRLDNGGAFEEARLRIAQACARRGIVAGIHATAALAPRHAAAGYRMITVASDHRTIAEGMARDLAAVREGRGAPPPASASPY